MNTALWIVIVIIIVSALWYDVTWWVATGTKPLSQWRMSDKIGITLNIFATCATVILVCGNLSADH